MKNKFKIVLLVLVFVLSLALTITACVPGGEDKDDDKVVTNTPSTDGGDDSEENNSDGEIIAPVAPAGKYTVYANLPFVGSDHLATTSEYKYFINVMSETEVTITLNDNNYIFLGAYIDEELVSSVDGFTFTMPREKVYITFEYETCHAGITFNYDSAIDGYILMTPHEELSSTGYLNIPKVYNDGVHGIKDVKEIAEGVFEGKTDVKRVTGGENLVKIGAKAFKDCVNLGVVSIGTKVEYLGDMAYYNTNAGGIICIPNSLEYFGYGAFGRTKIHGFSGNDLENFVLIDGNLCLLEEGVYTLLCSPMVSTGSTSLYEIPIEVSVLAPYALSGACFNTIAFESNDYLNTTGNENFTSIGEHAFEYTSVRTVRVPSTITTIEDYAFYGSSLINFYMHSIWRVVYIGDYAFAACERLDKEQYDVDTENNNYGIEDPYSNIFDFFTEVEYVGDYAFYNCKELRGSSDVTFRYGEGIEIGDYVFEGSNVTGVEFFECDLSNVSELAFANTGIKTIKLSLSDGSEYLLTDIFTYLETEKGMVTLFGSEPIYRIDFICELEENAVGASDQASTYESFANNFLYLEKSETQRSYIANVLTAEFYNERVNSQYNVWENYIIKEYYEISDTDESIAVRKSTQE